MKKTIGRICCSVLLSLVGTVVAEPHYKIHIDPVMAIADYANVQFDVAISPTVSTGIMLWHLDDDSWTDPDDQSSFGLRVDWFDSGVFDTGWHSNAMVKVDLEDGQYARTRLKLTQTFQWVRNSFFMNFGIGAQFVSESASTKDSVYDDYQSLMLPAWELSIGRAF